MELAVKSTFDLVKVREQFPILDQSINAKKLVYFDNAATSQKPLRVINSLTEYYRGYNSNIHRGIHTLAEKATKAFEDTRDAAKEFINAANREEIIFTSGVTASINLVASSYGRAFLNEGDEIIISGLEHHSNIVPWQLIAIEKKAVIKVIPVLENGELDVVSYKKLLSVKTKSLQSITPPTV
jgi:cysteine desulfurase/selenocysteine lyase